MPTKLAKISILSALLMSPFGHATQAPSSEKLLNMSLSELLRVKVSVASSEPESIVDTPAIVSRYDMSDMSAMGVKNLKEVLAFIPGVLVQDNRVGGSTVMIRGIVEGFNQKVLFLLDGIPYWMPSHSDIPLLGIPLQAISHVEVIRGPGAVYYGTNASAGVINVVTKQKQDTTLAFNYGSNQRTNLGGYYHKSINNDTHWSVAFETQREDGYKRLLSGVPQPPSYPDGIADYDQILKSEEMDSLLFNYHNDSFNLTLQTFKSLTDNHQEDTPLSIGIRRENKGSLAHLDYQWENKNNKIKLYTDYNRFYLQFPSTNLFGFGVDGGFRFSNDGSNNYRWRTGSTIDYNINQELKLFAGVEHEQRKIEDYNVYNLNTNADVLTLIDSQSVTEKSIFGHADYNFDDWRFLIGGRYTRNSQNSGKFTPRLSTVYQLTPDSSLKLLYSVGFNSPNFTQLFIRIPGSLEGNPELKAELIKTLDLAYSYHKNNTLFVANVYHLKTENFIQRGIENNRISFFNSGKFDRSGFELDYQKIIADFKIFTNLSYSQQGDETYSDDNVAAFVPKVATSLGLNYQLNDAHSAGFAFTSVSQRNQAKSAYLLNLNYLFEINNHQLSFSIKNVLDKDIIYPDTFDFVDEHLLQGSDGIGFLLGYQYRFQAESN